MPTTILDGETYPEALQRRYAEETKAEKQSEIIRMAREAGFVMNELEAKLCHPTPKAASLKNMLERFAALVREDTIDNFNRQINQACEEARLLDHSGESADMVQEPVAWVYVINSDNGPYEFHALEKMPKGKHHLYTTPPTAAQAARQMRDAAVNVCFTTDECNILELRQHIADTIAALPIPGEDK